MGGVLWHFGYDAEHRLVEVRRRQADGSAGAVFGKFTYDALGRRASAVYDDSGDGGLDDEAVEYFAYDPAWRLSCVYRQGPEDEFGVRPAPVAYERFLYADAGLAAADASFAPGFALDCPTHSQIDANADGTFERTRRFILNQFGDVAGVIEDHAPGAWSYELAEVVRYSTTGLPRVIGHFGADIDQSGGSPDDADVAAFFALYGEGDPRADFNGSGGTPDESDVALFFQVWDAGIGQGTPDDNRFGWRGYLWDARLGLYHVRHRVYDPRHAAWLTPDPAGYLDGLNLYAYCRGDLVNKFDPWGLDAWFIGNLLRDVGLDVLGEYADDFMDGAAEFLNPETQFGHDVRYTVIKAAIVAGVVVSIVTTGGSALIAAGGAYAVAGNVIYGIAAAAGVYFAGGAIYEAASGTELWTARRLTQEERYLRVADLLGGALGGYAGSAGRWAGPKIAKYFELAINPKNVNFSQTTAGGNGRSGVHRQTMKSGKWPGDPADVVRLPNGKLVTIDNTRMALAQELKHGSAPARIHNPGDSLPQGHRFGDLKTWGDVLLYRTKRNRLPFEGTCEMPLLTGG